MRATSLASLERWFARQRGMTERFPFLHNLVFGTEMLRYLIFRTRFVLSVSLLRIALHITEFGLLLYVLPTVMYHAMVYRLIFIAIESGWWGATDAMRHRIRLLRRQQDLNGIQREIMGWLTLAAIISVLVIGASIVAAILKSDRTLPFAAIIVAMGFQTAVRILSRTYYSGAYAIRRVFLPLELIVGPEILVFLLGVLFYHVFDEWSVSICLFASSLLAAAISYRYVRHVTDFLRVTPVKFFSRRMFNHVFRHHRLRTLILPALATLGMRLHEVFLIMSLQVAAYHSVFMHTLFPQHLLFSLYIVMPFMRSCMNWAQVMYFDLSKYSLDVFVRFRTTIERIGLAYSLLLSLVFCILTMLMLHFFAASLFYTTIPAILPYMIVSAALGFVLISLFARRRYMTVIALCTLQYGLLWPLIVAEPHLITIPHGMLISLLLPLAVGWWQLRAHWQPPRESIESYLPWMAALCRRDIPTTVMRIGFHPGAPRNLSMQVGRDIAFEHEGKMLICIGEESLLIAADMEIEPLRRLLLPFGQGFMVAMEAVRADHGVLAYLQAIDAHLIQHPEADESLPEGLISRFRQDFPTGLVQHPMRKNPAVLAATSTAERRDILLAARRDAPRDRKNRPERWYVTSVYTDPYLSVIFLVPRQDATPEARRAWQGHLERFNRAMLEKKYLPAAS